MSAPAPAPVGGGPGRLFPLPLVGAAVLLAVLIVLTPNLLSTGSPSAGSVESQLELLVDRAPSGDNATHVYLRGLSLVRYTSLSIAWGNLSGTTAPGSLAGVDWSSHVDSGPSLELDAVVLGTAFALNVSGVFVDTTGAAVLFGGEYAFVWSGGMLYTTAYGTASGAAPASLSQLPLVLLPPSTPLASAPSTLVAPGGA